MDHPCLDSGRDLAAFWGRSLVGSSSAAAHQRALLGGSELYSGRGIRREAEARKARKRLYPVTVLYCSFGIVVLALAVPARPLLSLLFYLTGAFVWSLAEYLTHRYVLHGRFPDGAGLLRRFAHKYFDPLHWEHHKRPWDGNHINGTISDTFPFLAPLVLVSFLAPLPTLPVFWAGFVHSYIVEEWVHHCVHFRRPRNRYIRYIKRHHLYHHSPKGSEVAYGLTTGFWDVLHGTRIPKDVRRALYGARSAGGRGRSATPSAGAA